MLRVGQQSGNSIDSAHRALKNLVSLMPRLVASTGGGAARTCPPLVIVGGVVDVESE